MNKTELVMRRRNVRAFIIADPMELIIHRKTKAIKNPNTGGYIAGIDLPPLKPQRARIVQNVRRFTNGIVNSEAGDIPNSEYRLIGSHTLDIEEDDEFEWLGEWYMVPPRGIYEARVESTFAAIVLRGPKNRGS